MTWTDLALGGFTALVIGTVAWVGASPRPGTESFSVASSASQPQPPFTKGKKKKKSKVKKADPSRRLEGLAGSQVVKTSDDDKDEETSGQEEENDEKGIASSVGEKSLHPLRASESGPGGISSSDESRDASVARPKDPEAIKSLTDRLRPPPAKTDVDDMIDRDIEPEVKYSRVMRITEESPSTILSSAESEVEEGWEKVPSSKARKSGSSTPLSGSASNSGTLPLRPAVPGAAVDTKKQRQNAKKKEAQKADKASEEADRLARLATHKRAQELARMDEQHAKASSSRAGVKAPKGSGGEWEAANQPKSSASSGKVVSGGMRAGVSEDGRLIWE